MAAGVRHLLLVSSVSVYGHRSVMPCSESSSCYPEGAYAESKWHAERRAIETTRGTATSLTILRMVTMFGEGDPGNIARLMRVIDRGHFVWIGDGSNRKSLIHREDAARACLCAVRAAETGVNIYNVSSPPWTVRELVEGLASALGRRLCPLHIPASLALGLTGMAAWLSNGYGSFGTARAAVQKWLADDVYDGSKFNQAFGFRPQVSLAEGLRREVAWYRQQSEQMCRPTQQ